MAWVGDPPWSILGSVVALFGDSYAAAVELRDSQVHKPSLVWLNYSSVNSNYAEYSAAVTFTPAPVHL